MRALLLTLTTCLVALPVQAKYSGGSGTAQDLASKGLGAIKHSGVLSLFDRHFVQTGDFPLEDGRHRQEAFELRQGSDYLRAPSRDQPQRGGSGQ